MRLTIEDSVLSLSLYVCVLSLCQCCYIAMNSHCTILCWYIYIGAAATAHKGDPVRRASQHPMCSMKGRWAFAKCFQQDATFRTCNIVRYFYNIRLISSPFHSIYNVCLLSSRHKCFKLLYTFYISVMMMMMMWNCILQYFTRKKNIHTIQYNILYSNKWNFN